MKCPICGGELKHETTTGIYCCPTIFIDCPLGSGTGAFGTKELWQELTKTKQALDVAVMALKEFDKNNICYGPAFEALHIIEQITETKE